MIKQKVERKYSSYMGVVEEEALLGHWGRAEGHGEGLTATRSGMVASAFRT